jgi:hypothetical protein
VAFCAKTWCGKPEIAGSQNTQVQNRGALRTFNVLAPCPKIFSAGKSLRDLRFRPQGNSKSPQPTAVALPAGLEMFDAPS